MTEVNPKPEEVAGKVPELREKFKEMAAGSNYDPRDVERMAKDDAYVRCFLRTLKSRGDVTKALDVIDTCLKFRKEIGINDLKEDSFPEEILSRKAAYYKGSDVHGNPILYMRTKENVAKGEEETNWLKKYIAFCFEQHHKVNPEQMCVVLLDMSGASSGNTSIDITKFIIKCFTDYFPAYLAYMLNYEMPMLLTATWKIISTFLTSDQKKKLLHASKKDITKYIPEEHLWPHMKKGDNTQM